MRYLRLFKCPNWVWQYLYCVLRSAGPGVEGYRTCFVVSSSAVTIQRFFRKWKGLTYRPQDSDWDAQAKEPSDIRACQRMRAKRRTLAKVCISRAHPQAHPHIRRLMQTHTPHTTHHTPIPTPMYISTKVHTYPLLCTHLHTSTCVPTPQTNTHPHINTYTHIHTSIPTHMHTHINTCTPTSAHAHPHQHMHTYPHLRAWPHTYPYSHTLSNIHIPSAISTPAYTNCNLSNIHTHTPAPAYTHTYTRGHTPAHTYTHTIPTHIYPHTYTRTRLHTYQHPHMYPYPHTYTNTHQHPQTHSYTIMFSDKCNTWTFAMCEQVLSMYKL